MSAIVTAGAVQTQLGEDLIPILDQLPPAHPECHRTWIHKRSEGLEAIAMSAAQFSAMAHEATAEGADVPKELGVTPERYAALLAGEGLLSARELARAAQAFDCTAEAIWTGIKAPLRTFWDIRATDNLNRIWREYRSAYNAKQDEFAPNELNITQGGFSLLLGGNPIGDSLIHRLAAAFSLSPSEIRPELAESPSDSNLRTQFHRLVKASELISAAVALPQDFKEVLKDSRAALGGC